MKRVAERLGLGTMDLNNAKVTELAVGGGQSTHPVR